MERTILIGLIILMLSTTTVIALETDLISTELNVDISQPIYEKLYDTKTVTGSVCVKEKSTGETEYTDITEPMTMYELIQVKNSDTTKDKVKDTKKCYTYTKEIAPDKETIIGTELKK